MFWGELSVTQYFMYCILGGLTCILVCAASFGGFLVHYLWFHLGLVRLCPSLICAILLIPDLTCPCITWPGGGLDM